MQKYSSPVIISASGDWPWDYRPGSTYAHTEILGKRLWETRAGIPLLVFCLCVQNIVAVSGEELWQGAAYCQNNRIYTERRKDVWGESTWWFLTAQACWVGLAHDYQYVQAWKRFRICLVRMHSTIIFYNKYYVGSENYRVLCWYGWARSCCIVVWTWDLNCWCTSTTKWRFHIFHQ